MTVPTLDELLDEHGGSLVGADLRGARLPRVNFRGVDLRGADLPRTLTVPISEGLIST